MQQTGVHLLRQGRKGIAVGLLLALGSLFAGVYGGGGVILLFVLVPGYAIAGLFFVQNAFQKGFKTLGAWNNLITFNLTLLCFVAAAIVLIAVDYVTKVGVLALLKQIYIGHR